MTAADVVVAPKSVREFGAVAKAPAGEPAVGRWPGWLRVLILFGGAAGLWAGIAWIAMRVMKLG